MQRLQNILNSEKYKNIVFKISEYEKDRKFCRHTLEHFVDTARICYILVLEDGEISLPVLTKEVIYAAGLLHDLGRLEEYETGRDHALVGAEIAQEFLKEEFTYREIEIITAAIKEHRHLPKSPTYLGEKLFQADKLSRPCFNCAVLADCHKKELALKLHNLTY